MKPYSKDLRIRVLAAVDRGSPRREGDSRDLRRLGANHQALAEAAPGDRRRRCQAALRPARAQGPSAGGDPACPGLAQPRPHARGAPRALRGRARPGGLGLQPQPRLRAFGAAAQKKSLPASERDEAERARWHEGVRRLAPGRLVFVDECGTHTSMTRLRARAPRGERAYGKVPRNRGKNTTLLASMGAEGMGPCMAVVGSTTKAVFETYLERVLAPSLRPGQVVVMDNLGAHRGERVRALVEARGCSLVYLPPYSPDFSPIQEAFSKLSRRSFGRPRPERA